MLVQGHQNGSVGKGTKHQPWLPEFGHKNPRGEGEKWLPPAVLTAAHKITEKKKILLTSVGLNCYHLGRFQLLPSRGLDGVHSLFQLKDSKAEKPWSMTGSSRAISGSIDRVSLGRKAFVRSEETHTAKHTERSRKAENPGTLKSGLSSRAGGFGGFLRGLSSPKLGLVSLNKDKEPDRPTTFG